jgi:hypothetical protein
VSEAFTTPVDAVTDSSLVHDALSGGTISRDEFYRRLRSVQDEVKRLVPDGRSLADELIAERRAAAVREEAEWNSQS